MRVLCFNAGSSSVRIAAFESAGGALSEPFARRSVTDAEWRSSVDPAFIPDVVAHRIVRGKKTALAAEIYTPEVHAEISAAEDLAPTHDARALALLASSQIAYPDAEQIVVYDTAFHAEIPAEYATYAIPERWRAQGIRRVGYHGLSCAYAAEWLREHAGDPACAVHAHLGNGCSVTGLRFGKSVATTMGYTPLEGVVMGTRSGSIDPAIVLQLQRGGNSGEQLQTALFRESGLQALCGTNDMRAIVRRRDAGDEAATLAFNVFVASVCGAIAQMAAAAGGLDALTFGGGIGQNSDAVRDAICRKLHWMIRETSVYALDVQEERIMAAAALEKTQGRLRPA